MTFWVQLWNLTRHTQDGRHIVHGNLKCGIAWRVNWPSAVNVLRKNTYKIVSLRRVLTYFKTCFVVLVYIIHSPRVALCLPHSVSKRQWLSAECEGSPLIWHWRVTWLPHSVPKCQCLSTKQSAKGHPPSEKVYNIFHNVKITNLVFFNQCVHLLNKWSI